MSQWAKMKRALCVHTRVRFSLSLSVCVSKIWHLFPSLVPFLRCSHLLETFLIIHLNVNHHAAPKYRMVQWKNTSGRKSQVAAMTLPRQDRHSYLRTSSDSDRRVLFIIHFLPVPCSKGMHLCRIHTLAGFCLLFLLVDERVCEWVNEKLCKALECSMKVWENDLWV